jgi:hypothetical protein
MHVSPPSPERVGDISRTSFWVTLPINLNVTSALLKVMGQNHVPAALLGGWEGGVEGMQRIRGMGHRASLGAVVKKRPSPDANRTAVVQFTDMLLQSTDYPGCGRRHYMQMTDKPSQDRPFLFHLSPLDTVLSRYMLPSRSCTPVVHTLTSKTQLERIMNVKIETVKPLA